MAKITNPNNVNKQAEFEITVTGEDGKEYHCILCAPDRNTIAAAFAARANGKVLEAGEVVLEDCYMQCDEEIMTQTMLKVAASLSAIETINLPKSSLKKISL